MSGLPLSKQVHEALAIARRCDEHGDKVGWIAAVTIAAQLVQLAKLFGDTPEPPQPAQEREK